MIRIRQLTKRYGDNAVLRGVDLDAAPGEFVVVLGESGAGKSTLLRCVNRLAVADGGELEVGGMDAVRCMDTRALRQRVAMIFQHHNVVPRLSALKNVLTGRLSSAAQTSNWRTNAWAAWDWPTRRMSEPIRCPAGRCSAWASPARSRSNPG